MKPMVIDASMAAAWIIDDEKTPAGDQILEESKRIDTITPPLFWYEIRNLLVMYEKRGRGATGSAWLLLRNLRRFGFKEQASHDEALILNLAFGHHLSAYDATYLALTITSNAILATNDRKLANAALQADVELRTALALL